MRARLFPSLVLILALLLTPAGPKQPRSPGLRPGRMPILGSPSRCRCPVPREQV